MTTCKNCKTKLQPSNHFCPNCGAKIINNRLTFFSILEEVFSIFSWENSFFKTFLHLFTRPDEVLIAYVEGVRKRYMRPISYMIVSLTIYGIYMYFAKDSMLQFMESYHNNGEASEFSKQYFSFAENVLLNNFNMLSFVTIPMTALFTLFIFRKRQYNFLEHNIFFTYANAHYNFVAVIFGLFGLLFSISFNTVSGLNIIFLLLYYAFIFKKVFKLSWLRTLWKIVLFVLLIGITFFIIGIMIAVIYLVIKKQFN